MGIVAFAARFGHIAFIFIRHIGHWRSGNPTPCIASLRAKGGILVRRMPSLVFVAYEALCRRSTNIDYRRLFSGL
jgi:hypothetical protein